MVDRKEHREIKIWRERKRYSERWRDEARERRREKKHPERDRVIKE